MFIARGVTSLSSLAVEAARAHLGVLDRCRALIIGAGKLNDLQTNATAHVAARRAEVCAVQGIVGEEVESFSRWLQSLNVTPTIRALRARADQIRRSELDDHLSRLHQLSEHDRRIIETMTASIVGRLLHDPTRRLKQCAGDSDGLQYAAALRKLFALDEEPDAA